MSFKGAISAVSVEQEKKDLIEKVRLKREVSAAPQTSLLAAAETRAPWSLWDDPPNALQLIGPDPCPHNVAAAAQPPPSNEAVHHVRRPATQPAGLQAGCLVRVVGTWYCRALIANERNYAALMDSWRRKRERWKDRRAQLQNGDSQQRTSLNSGQQTGTPVDTTVKPSTKYHTAFLTAAAPNPKATVPDRSAEAWKRGLAAVETSREWTICCELVERETGASLTSQPSNSANGPIQQIADLIGDVSKLLDVRAQAKSNKFGKVLSITMTTLQVVKDLGAAAAAFNPYAAFGWNIVQFVISIAITDSAVRDEVCESLPEVLERTIRYQTWIKVYDQTQIIHVLADDLDRTLEALYTSLLNYQLAVVISLHSSKERAKTSFLGQGASRARQALEDLLAKEQQLSALFPALDREINDGRFSQLENSLQALRKILQEDVMVLSRKVDTLVRDQVLNWVSPLRYEEAHNELKRQAAANTTDWLLNHRDYVAWNDTTSTNCLWLKGFMGSGKSCCVNAIIKDQISRSVSKGELFQTLYFYCDKSDAERMSQIDSHEKILRNLVKQLVDCHSDSMLPASLLDVYDHQHQKSKLTANQCVDLLLKLSNRCFDLKIVVDGLDECSPTVQDSLLACLQRVVSERPKRFKLLIACRDEQGLEIVLKDMVTGSINVVDHNEAAIRQMVQAKIDEYLSNPRKRHLYTELPDLAPKVFKKVIDNAHGMFRFVQAAFDYLHDAENALFMKDRLEELHQLNELGKLYDKNWEDAMRRKKPKEQKVLVLALCLLIYGVSYGIHENTRSKTASQDSQHILEACTFVFRSQDQLKERLSVRNIVDTCPSFLIASASTAEIAHRNGWWREQTSGVTLRVIHVSVTEYLVERHPEWFSPVSANALIATVCMRTFIQLQTLPDFTSLSPNGLALYAGMCWAEHVRLAQSNDPKNPASIEMATAIHAFLQDGYCSPSFQRWTLLMKQFRRNLLYNGRLPVITNKDDLDIFAALSFVTQPPCSLFARLYLNLDTTSFTPRECQNIRTSWEYKSKTVTPQTFAAVMGLEGAIEFLASRGCSPSEQNDLGETSGHVLWREGPLKQSGSKTSLVSIFRALVRAKLDLNIRDNQGNTCFFDAIKSAFFDDQVLQIFLRNGFDLQAAEPCSNPSRPLPERPPMTPLKFALAYVRRPQALEALLSHYVSLCPDPVLSRNWLFLAVYYEGSPEVVKLLINKFGADPRLPNEFGQCPLELVMDIGVGRGRLQGSVLDILAPWILRPGVLTKSMPLVVAIFQGILRLCNRDTVKLFVEHVAPLNCGYSLWGARPITEALLFNQPHGLDIARYFYEEGYRNAGDSRVFQKWRRGELQEDEVGSGREYYDDTSKALLDDEVSDEEFWEAEEEVWFDS